MPGSAKVNHRNSVWPRTGNMYHGNLWVKDGSAFMSEGRVMQADSNLLLSGIYYEWDPHNHIHDVRTALQCLSTVRL